MAKSATKKASKAPPLKKGSDKKKKLPRGYKQCGQCRQLLHIHKYVCDKCGFKHDMKKKKVDILKNLNKVTPKLLRSLIELNDFNDLADNRPKQQVYTDLSLPKSELSVPQDYKKRRSSKAQASGGHQINWSTFDKNRGFYTKMNPNLVCLCPLLEGVLVAESIEKHAQMTPSQKVTIRAYKLEHFHKAGQIYTGKSCLHYLTNKRQFCKVTVNDHVTSLKSISNRVGLLTGRGTVLVTDFETSFKNFQDKSINIHNTLQIKAGGQDQITVFEWLKTYSSHEKVTMIVGTLMGHLYVYQIHKSTAQLYRFICNAHFEAVTCISECPLNNQNECLFASGSYDGTLSVWNLHQRSPIYRVQASNRKIYSLVWDPGAKFIFVVRDENQDSGVLACFFAILKNEESVALSDQLDFRLVKNTFNCKVLHSDSSKRFCLLDSYQCSVRMIEVQQLRKNSLKRKKVKRQEEEAVLKLVFESNSMAVIEQQIEEQGKIEQKLNEETLTLPIIADACQTSQGDKQSIWGISYNGFIFHINMT